MMNLSRLTQSLFVLSLLWAAAPLPLGAQSAPKSISVKFSCVIWENLTISNLFYRQGKKYLPLQLSPGNRSELYTLQDTTALELCTLAVDEQGKEYYKRIGQAALPAGSDRALFFIFERKTADGLPLTVSGIDDSLKTFPRGSFRFVNSTPVELKVTFGGVTTPIAPQAMTVVPSQVSKDGGLLPFLVKDAANRNLYETRFFSQPTGRDMVFIAPPRRPGEQVLIKFLAQLIAAEPAKPAGQ
jgi:hypothetical protein